MTTQDIAPIGQTFGRSCGHFVVPKTLQMQIEVFLGFERFPWIGALPIVTVRLYFPVCFVFKVLVQRWLKRAFGWHGNGSFDGRLDDMKVCQFACSPRYLARARVFVKKVDHGCGCGMCGCGEKQQCEAYHVMVTRSWPGWDEILSLQFGTPSSIGYMALQNLLLRSFGSLTLTELADWPNSNNCAVSIIVDINLEQSRAIFPPFLCAWRRGRWSE